MKKEKVIEVEFNQEMIDKDLELQKNDIEENLIQDTFNEDSIDEMNDDSVVVENVVQY